MRRVMAAATAAALLGTALPVPASAGIYTDDMTRCLVRATAGPDQEVLMRWIFTIFAASPVTGNLANVTPAQRDASHEAAARLMQRLVLVDCKTETVAALKYEGSSAFEASFGALGQVAVRGLMTDPSVGAEMQRFATHIDAQKMEALLAEAGLQSGAKPAAGKPGAATH